VANELVILIRPQLHDDAHCAAALVVHVSHSLPRRKRASSGWPGDKLANILTALRPTSTVPAASRFRTPHNRLAIECAGIPSVPAALASAWPIGNAPQGGASDPLSGAMHKISVSLFSYGTCLVTRQDLGVSK
jgi:hypothetical protein